MIKNALISIATIVSIAISNVYSQNKKPAYIESWIRNADRSVLFRKQADSIFFSNSNRGGSTPIVIDDAQQFQEANRFGFALTGGSAELLIKMSSADPKNDPHTDNG